MIITDKHVFFYNDWISNFHPCDFDMMTIHHKYQHFTTSEQAFMFLKAETFKDEEIANKILLAKTPREAKDLGRQVKNYDDKLWSDMRFTCMYSCNYHKYDQNENLLDKLLDNEFDGKLFVEASPFDKIWGIALDSKKVSLEVLDNENNWKGTNLLGKVITSVRENLKESKGK